MKAPTEEDIARYINTWISRNPSFKALIDRHFQGTITAVRSINSDFSPPFLCNIQRQDGIDNNDYLCVIPGYFPKIGDVVDCEKRDTTSGYIKYVLQSSFPPGYGTFFEDVVSVAKSTITILNIPKKCAWLEITYTARSDQGGTSIGYIDWQKNQVGGTAYDTEIGVFSGAATTVVESRGASAGRCGLVTQSGSPTSWFTHGKIEIPYFFSIFTVRKLLWETDAIYNNTAGTIQKYQGVSGTHDNTDALVRLDLTIEGGGSFIPGSRFTARVR